MVEGKRVAVLGGSKSATDIAVNAVQNGATSVTWVYREPIWRVPYFVGGINFKRLLYMRAQEKDLCTIQDFLTVVNFVFFRRSE
jgi:cation diffusion facilitator CzcD-associated flavoprotein CzcO